MTRPVRACINLQALGNNLAVVRRHAPDSYVMAVVKANAYGHGALPVSAALTDADALAVASLEEALQLRDGGIQKDIILLEGLFSADELNEAIHNRLQLVVHCEQQLAWLEQHNADTALHVWLKIDTGMHRLGFSPQQAEHAWQRLQALTAVQAGSVRWLSHLACADEPDHPLNQQQQACFEAAINSHVESRSLANSAMILTPTHPQYDWVRPGIMLYGASPMKAGDGASFGLQPVMTLETRLIAVQQRLKGESIGYSQTWTCPQDMLIGIAAIGYGDGYPRHAPNGTPVLVNGTMAPLAGRVSMDMICVDLSNQPDAKAGDPVTLWGKGLAAESLARHCGTISYELFCGVTERVPRIYTEA